MSDLGISKAIIGDRLLLAAKRISGIALQHVRKPAL